MPFVKGGRIAGDPYLPIADDAPVPGAGAVLVPAKRLLAGAGEFAHRAGATGVLWPNDRDARELAPYLDRLALVALVFPNFRDGRAYSQARILRERYRFGGELRATGQVLRDQFLFLHRAGFDAFEVAKPADAAAFAEATGRYSVFYQPAADGGVAAFRRRLSSPAAAPAAPAAPAILHPAG